MPSSTTTTLPVLSAQLSSVTPWTPGLACLAQPPPRPPAFFTTLTAIPPDPGRSCGRTMDYDCGSRIRGRNGGSSMADSISCGLIVVVMADPVSRWHQIMVVDHNRGRRLMMDPNKRQWTMTVDYSGSDLDGGP
ncbi:unnamed protein product [Pleuronectes platessa]|uniref:Uncharacterized protein n=1 Tax=Pleuronectes platessa TaxID=8262 RepID=A0A9N7UGT6_PLEPL|nr:unnamed protein product [Pleuronectes platessa]